MEMDLQTEKYQTVEEDTQVVEAEPDNNEDSPEEERTYSQAEVEEIIREHLLRFQALPVQETQQTTELIREEKSYLEQKIRKYVNRFGRKGLSKPTEINLIGEYAEDNAEKLYGFLDATNLESFTAAVDAVFDLIEFSEEQGYKTGYSRCRSDYEEKAQKQEPKEEEINIVSEIFRTGGR